MDWLGFEILFVVLMAVDAVCEGMGDDPMKHKHDFDSLRCCMHAGKEDSVDKRPIWGYVLAAVLLALLLWAHFARAQSLDAATAQNGPCLKSAQTMAQLTKMRECTNKVFDTVAYFKVCKGETVANKTLDADQVVSATVCSPGWKAQEQEVRQAQEQARKVAAAEQTATTRHRKVIRDLIIFAVVLIWLLIYGYKSLVRIGPAEVGLMGKRWSAHSLSNDNPVAFVGEAGYQSRLLMPGLRFVWWPLFWVERYPWVQVPAGEIGIVYAQVGNPIPTGARTAVYNPGMESFSDLPAFLAFGGQKGIQRKVLLPGALLPMHPVAFLVFTSKGVYGKSMSEDLALKLEPEDYRLVVVPSATMMTTQRMISVPARKQEQSATRSAADKAMQKLAIGDMNAVQLAAFQNYRPASEVEYVPAIQEHSTPTDVVGIVTAYEGAPLEHGDIASRIGGFEDVKTRTEQNYPDGELIELILGTKNNLHQNYQDAQEFLDKGGKVGMQHDPLLPGSYALNPFVFRVALVPMLVVEQGQVAVIKSYVGLASERTDQEFKFGALVRPGHRGLWRTALHTGKYALNPHCYRPELVPTAILTLEWSKAETDARSFDRNLSSITAKSREGFPFSIDLHVQIHIPDSEAPRVISMVGTVQNLVDEILQAAVGNHFRAKLQALTAVEFIEEREKVQVDAYEHVAARLTDYHVETKGVFIQDVVMPGSITEVLQQRLVAAEQEDTYHAQQKAQEARREAERARGVADAQGDLAKSEVNMQVQLNAANARKAEADGESTYIQRTWAAKGLGEAEGYQKQVDALGQTGTTIVNTVKGLPAGSRFVPEVFVGNGGNLLDAVAARFALPANGKES